MRKRSASLCWFLMGLGIMSVAGKENKVTKETVKKGSGDPYWCGPKLEEVCYEGDSKEEKDWNVDENGHHHKEEKPKEKPKEEKPKEEKPKEEKPKEEKPKDEKHKDEKHKDEKKTTTTKKPKDTSMCDKDFDSGHCFSSKPMYYYRKETKKCEMFVYGGCGGNENRFDTQKACQEKCGGS